MFSNKSVWLRMRDGYHLLTSDREGRITLSDPSQTSMALVYPQPAESFSACMGSGDIAHVLICTHGGNLIYGVTADGRKWRKYTLTRSGQENGLRDPIIFSRDESVHILYVAEQNQSEALIHYQQNAAGNWIGNAIDVFDALNGVRPLQIIAHREDVYLFMLASAQNRAQIRRYSLLLEPGKWTEALLAPLPFTDFHVCRHEDQLHMCWLSDGRVYVDGTPLTWSERCRIPCMRVESGKISCVWMEPDGVHHMILGSPGWQAVQVSPLKSEPELHILLESGDPIRSMQAPDRRPVSLPQCPPPDPDGASRGPADPQVQRIASQTMMLFRQMSNRIDRLERDMEILRGVLPGVGGRQDPPPAAPCRPSDGDLEA